MMQAVVYYEAVKLDLEGIQTMAYCIMLMKPNVWLQLRKMLNKRKNTKR